MCLLAAFSRRVVVAYVTLVVYYLLFVDQMDSRVCAAAVLIRIRSVKAITSLDFMTSSSPGHLPHPLKRLYFMYNVVQYDVINHGKDGIGAVSSSGQGSLWRLEALKGQRPDGTCTEDPKNLALVGKKLGFRSEMLIEDTHTSIELFRQVKP